MWLRTWNDRAGGGLADPPAGPRGAEHEAAAEARTGTVRRGARTHAGAHRPTTGSPMRWYRGMSEVSSRSATPAEIERVRGWYAAELRADRLCTVFRLLSVAVGVAVAIVVGQRDAAGVSAGPISNVLVASLVVGAFVGPAVVWPFAEIAIGFSERARRGFALLVGAVAAAGTSAWLGEGTAEGVLTGVALLTLGSGLATMASRTEDWYRLRATARVVRHSLRRGEVVRFGGSEEARALESGGAADTIEILAPVGLVLSRNGVDRVSRLRVELPWLGERGPRGDLAPLTAFEVGEPGRQARLQQRELSGAERREIRRLAWHLLQRDVLQSAGVLWLCAVALDWADDAVRGVADGARPEVLALALCLGGAHALWVHRVPRRLLRDARRGLAVVCLQSRTRSGKIQAEEVLPYSGRIWTVGGAPHPWRLHALEEEG